MTHQKDYWAIDQFLTTALGRQAYKITLPCAMPKALMMMAASFIYCKVSCSDIAAVNTLETWGFHLIETNVRLQRPIVPSRSKGDFTIRTAVMSDEEEVVALAARVFSCSRFHVDPQFTNEQANGIKASWIRNFFKGQRGDTLLLVEEGSSIIGFILLLVQNEDVVIDLLGVASTHRRKGAASQMIDAAMASFHDRRRIIVGTQLCNTTSLSAYEKSGFRISGADYVFHYHGAMQS